MVKKEDIIEKYTKKASARILAEVLKVNPKASKLTTLDQAFVILMTHWDMELGLITKLHQPTKVLLYRDENIPTEWEFENGWNEKQGDFDWNTIYKVVLEDVIKRRLYKRPKLGKKAQKKYDEEVANKKAIREAESKQVETEKPKVSLVELKQQRGILSSKISYWRKTKRTESEIAILEVQLNKIKEQIKNY